MAAIYGLLIVPFIMSTSRLSVDTRIVLLVGIVALSALKLDGDVINDTGTYFNRKAFILTIGK